MNSSLPSSSPWRQQLLSIHTLAVSSSSHRSGQGIAWLVGFFFSFRSAMVFLAVHFVGADPQTGSVCVIVASGMLLALTAFHSFATANGKLKALLQLRSSRWIGLYLAFSCLSFCWSGAVSPLASFAYWSAMSADVFTVALVLAAGSPAERGHAMMHGYIASTCSLVALAWLMPAQSDLRLGDPDYFNTNQIANLCVFGLFFALYLARRNYRRGNIVIVFLSITLLRTLSKTTLIAFLASQAYLLVRDRAITCKTKALLTCAAVVATLLFWGLFSNYYDIYTNTANQAETFTGRTAIWAFASEHAIEKPWLGNGFDSMWKVMPPFGSDQFEARHAENEILQQFYSYGIVGVALIGGLYISFYRQIRGLRDTRVRVLLSSLMLFIMIRGLAEAEPFDLLLPLWSILLFSAMVSPQLSPECNLCHGPR